MNTPSFPLTILPTPIRLVGVGLIAALIFYYSIITVPPATPVDQAVPGMLSLAQWRHILAYFGLGLAIAYVLVVVERPWYQKALVVVGTVVGYGASIELVQSLHPGRQFDLMDIVLNGIGGMLSTTWYLLERRAVPVSITGLMEDLG